MDFIVACREILSSFMESHGAAAPGILTLTTNLSKVGKPDTSSVHLATLQVAHLCPLWAFLLMFLLPLLLRSLFVGWRSTQHC